MLKKPISLLIACAMLLSLGACNAKSGNSNDNNSSSEEFVADGKANPDYFYIGDDGEIMSLSDKGKEQKSLVIPAGYSMRFAMFRGAYKQVAFESDDDIDISSAFMGSDTLEAIKLPANIKILQSSAFSKCTSLKSISFPSGITEIPSRCCGDDSSLESVTFEGNVTAIGDQAFESCTSLKNLELPDSIVTIGVRAFYSCDSLDTVTLPKGLKNIGISAFGTTGDGISTFIVPAEMELESWDNTAFVQLGITYTVKVSKGSWADTHFDEVFGGQVNKEYV